MKIGIFVGSFNPPHKGHINIINHLINNNILDKIIVVPTGNYWDKQDLIDIKDRINMLKFFESEKIIIDNKHNDIKYTYQIMKDFSKEYKTDQLSLIIGADNIINFNKWKNYQELLKYNLIIMTRNHIDISKYLIEYHIKNYLIIDNYPYIDISSTIIRNKINNKYLDKRVLNYIKENKLYLKRGIYEN